MPPPLMQPGKKRRENSSKQKLQTQPSNVSYQKLSALPGEFNTIGL